MPYRDSVTIACISDTHELHGALDVPPADLLIHAGDHAMTDWGRAEVLEYDAWLGSLPHERKILVPGNHDRWLLDPALRRLITHATILIDKSVEVLQLKVWGSGVHLLAGEPFGVGSPAERAKLYATIPGDVNIIVTHTPAYGVVDCALDRFITQAARNSGRRWSGLSHSYTCSGMCMGFTGRRASEEPCT